MPGLSTTSETHAPNMPVSRVLHLWAPLAASWALMAVELPMLTAVVARLPDATVHLAAYGSIVFPVSLVVEGPIIMLLAASTALCTHERAYRQVHRFMMVASAVLTALHMAIAFTPLYEVVAVSIMGAPEEILEPGRLGLQIMTPWTWSIAYRRFHQGVMIRHEHSREVSLGTLVRLIANGGALLIGYTLGLPGIVVGATAIATGVVIEAIYIGWRVRPVLRERVFPAPPKGDPLTLSSFLQFYVPLALTPVITLMIQPIGAAAMNRMPVALDSLAAWPAVHGLVFISRSVGMAYNEVVVTLVGKPGSLAALKRFQTWLMVGTMSALGLLAATPLAELWFGSLSSLPPQIVALCTVAIALAIPMPGYAVLQSWYQGALVKTRTTRPITEAVLLYFALSSGLLMLGIHWQGPAGIHWALSSFVIAGICQTTWLWWRSRGAFRSLAGTDYADS